MGSIGVKSWDPITHILPGLGVDEIFTRSESAGTRSFLSDSLGSTLALTDSVGAVQTEYTYESFGRTTITGPASTNPYQFTGRENDATGLYYYRFRYYHPIFQRFVSEDPFNIASAQLARQKTNTAMLGYRLTRRLIYSPSSLNAYSYVLNSPLNFVDPLGLDVVCVYVGTVAVCYRRDAEGRVISGPILVGGPIGLDLHCGHFFCHFSDEDFDALFPPYQPEPTSNEPPPDQPPPNEPPRGCGRKDC